MTFQERKSPPEQPDGVSHINPTIVIQGETSGREDLVVKGQVRGKVELPENDLIIEERGKVDAEVRIRNARIKGEFIGKMTASGKVIIERTGRMRGDVAAGLISIEDGARFKGAVKILPRP